MQSGEVFKRAGVCVCVGGMWGFSTHVCGDCEVFQLMSMIIMIGPLSCFPRYLLK